MGIIFRKASAKTQVSLTRFLQSEVKIIHIIVQDQDGQNNMYFVYMCIHTYIKSPLWSSYHLGGLLIIGYSRSVFFFFWEWCHYGVFHNIINNVSALFWLFLVHVPQIESLLKLGLFCLKFLFGDERSSKDNDFKWWRWLTLPNKGNYYQKHSTGIKNNAFFLTI